MQRSLASRAWYGFLKFACQTAFVAFCQLRRHGEEKLPISGGGLVLSSHQSHLDPILIGMCSPRRLSFVARTTLFGFPPIRWLIQSLDAIPIDREGSGLGGLKETLKRLKRGEMIVLFPEGTRTPNGDVQPIKPGFCAVARRAEVPIVPVAMDGSYDAWPRQHRFPRPAVIHVVWGEPIMPDVIAALDDDGLVAEVERRIRQCHAAARQKRERAMWCGEGVSV